jgi:NAD(P)-dependent dehydrogenase (short-subunit alcohol dehydrogenase family)
MAGLLEGKSALITGGGSGIGKAAALAFAREGARVVVADLHGEAAQETVREIEKAGGGATGIGCDVSKAGDVRGAVGRVVAELGRIDCAFNNAGVASGQLGMGGLKTAEWTEEAFDKAVSVNLKGVWLCMKYELLAMLAQGSGVIVNTSSTAGIAGIATHSGYAATKHGVVGLTRTAAIEYAPLGIRVNAICPGFIRTPMTAELWQGTSEKPRATTVPMGRAGEAEEVAEMAVFLCADRASFVTGAIIPVDGGTAA